VSERGFVFSRLPNHPLFSHLSLGSLYVPPTPVYQQRQNHSVVQTRHDRWFSQGSCGYHVKLQRVASYRAVVVLVVVVGLCFSSHYPLSHPRTFITNPTVYCSWSVLGVDRSWVCEGKHFLEFLSVHDHRNVFAYTLREPIVNMHHFARLLCVWVSVGGCSCSGWILHVISGGLCKCGFTLIPCHPRPMELGCMPLVLVLVLVRTLALVLVRTLARLLEHAGCCRSVLANLLDLRKCN
jgi:hypothetical protein